METDQGLGQIRRSSTLPNFHSYNTGSTMRLGSLGATEQTEQPNTTTSNQSTFQSLRVTSFTSHSPELVCNVKANATNERLQLAWQQEDNFQNYRTESNDSETLYNHWAHAQPIIDALDSAAPSALPTQQLAAAHFLLSQISTAMANDTKSLKPSYIPLQQLDHTVDAIKSNMKSWSELFCNSIIPMINTPTPIPTTPIPINSRADSAQQLNREPNRELSHRLGFNYSQFIETNSSLLPVQQWVADQPSGSYAEKYRHVETHFRGVHQMSEIGFWVQRRLYTMAQTPNLSIDQRCHCMRIAARLWDRLSHHVMTLKQMDPRAYAEYRHALTGTSGAGSRQLKHLKIRTTQLERAFIQQCEQTLNIEPTGTVNENTTVLINTLASALSDPAQHPDLYNEYVALSDLLTSDYQFWHDHAALAASTNGMNAKGTQDMEVANLFKRSAARFNYSTLLKVIDEVGKQLEPQLPMLKVEKSGFEGKIGVVLSERL